MTRFAWWATAATFVSTTLLSFFLFVGERVGGGHRDEAAARVVAYGRNLVECGRRKEAIERHSRCAAIAKELAIAAMYAPPSAFDYHKSSVFKILLAGRILSLVKEPCVDSDLRVQTFAWNLLPTDTTVLPPDRQEYGTFSGSVEFKEIGYRVEQACVMSIELPVDLIRRFEIGQWERSTNQWQWKESF